MTDRMDANQDLSRSIIAMGDCIIGDKDDIFTDKLRQDSRLLHFSKYKEVRRASQYTNYRNLGFKRSLDSTGKMIDQNQQININEIERSQQKMIKMQQQYEKKLRKSVSLPTIEESTPKLKNFIQKAILTRGKVAKIDREELPWKREGSSASFPTPLLKRRISLRESAMMNSDSSDDEEEETKNQWKDVVKTLIRNKKSSTASSGSHSTGTVVTGVSASKLSPLKSSQTSLQPQVMISSPKETVRTPENSPGVARKKHVKLTRHQKRLLDWRHKENDRNKKMWNEFDRIMHSFSDFLQIDYVPFRVNKEPAVYQRDRQAMVDQPRLVIETAEYLKALHFPYGTPDQLVFKY